MRIIYRSRGNGEAEIEIYGETHTFLNLLTSYLNKNLTKGYSSYRIEHPLKQEATLYIYTGGRKPRDVLVRSVNDLIKDLELLEEKLSKVAKKE